MNNGTQGVTATTPPPLPERRPVSGMWWVAAGVVVMIGAAVLYAVNPATARILPPCPFLALTGLYCPGCGSTRAMHQLLHGRVGTAFDLNPLVVVLLPFVLVAVARALWCTRPASTSRDGAGEMPAPQQARRLRWAGWALLVLVLAFGVVRNLPWKPVRWMAP